jgi:hypothetical protein
MPKYVLSKLRALPAAQADIRQLWCKDNGDYQSQSSNKQFRSHSYPLSVRTEKTFFLALERRQFRFLDAQLRAQFRDLFI